MNVCLQRLLLFLSLAIAVPILSDAQTTVQVRLETYQNQPYQYNFISTPNSPLIMANPQHGTFTYVEYPGDSFVGTYTPDPDYVGLDYFRVFVWKGDDPGQAEIKDITIDVMPAQVNAAPDYGYTFENTDVSIDVLANDFSSNPSLRLKSLSVANFGSATFDPGSPFIDFSPDPDFSGTAYLNYTVCDNAGICDNGTLTISVIPTSEQDDTLHIFTKKNRPQVVLVPELFQLGVEPLNGQFDNSGDFPTYIPDEDFVGTDEMSFSYNNARKVVRIEVLDLEDNYLAFDDKAYTAPGEAVELNVLDNDTYGENSGCFQLVDGPRYGEVTPDGNLSGLLTYQPFSGFTGVDIFTYAIGQPDCEGETETATVYIYVGNFEPASSKYLMVTPKFTPLVIGNNVPISNFRFRIADQGELGEAFFLENEADTTIYGQVISGYNMIVYVPNSTTTSGTDEFEVVYCVLSGGECVFEKSVKIEVEILDLDNNDAPLCIGDCVWPGDINLDGVVNITDLLPLGLHMGKVGKGREEADLNQWYGQYGEDWNVLEDPSVNLKHVDTNGDSLITGLDTLAISRFYGRTHSLNASTVPFYEHSIRLKGNFVVKPGDLIVLDMYLGNENQPAEDVYGFTFPFRYDPNFFKPESIGIHFAQGSFLDYNSPVLQMTHNNYSGLAEGGFTRTNNNKVSGYGKIGTVVSAIIDDIYGFKLTSDTLSIKVGGGTATMMNSQGQTFGVNIEEVEIQVQLDLSDREEPVVPHADQLLVFPNPARNVVDIHLNGGQEFERLLIFNAMGQAVHELKGLTTQHVTVDVSQWPQGMYFVNVYTAGGVVNKKLEVVKR